MIRLYLGVYVFNELLQTTTQDSGLKFALFER